MKIIVYHQSRNPNKTDHCHYCCFRNIGEEGGCGYASSLGLRLTGRDCADDDGHYSVENVA